MTGSTNGSQGDNLLSVIAVIRGPIAVVSESIHPGKLNGSSAGGSVEAINVREWCFDPVFFRKGKYKSHLADAMI